MIWTTKLVGGALRLSHYGGGVMTTNVEEAPQQIVVATHQNDWFAGNLAGHVLSRFAYLVEATNHLPGTREDGLHLQIIDAFVRVPRRRDRRGLRERCAWVVTADDLSK